MVRCRLVFAVMLVRGEGRDLERGACDLVRLRLRAEKLRIAIGECLIRSIGEQRAPPVGGQAGQRSAAELDLLDDFVSQQAA